MLHKALSSRLILIILLQLAFVVCIGADLDKKKITELTSRADEIMESSPEEAILILKNVLENTFGVDFKAQRAAALKSMGRAQYYEQNYRQSLEYYEQSLKLYRELEDNEGAATILNNTGLLFERQGDFAIALKRYNEASVLFSKIDDAKPKLTLSLLNIGNVYYTLGRFDKALEYLSRALKNSESISDSLGMAPCYNNIGNVYLSLREYNSAIQFYLKAEAIHKVFNEKKKLSTVYNNIGEAYLGLNKINDALNYNQLALEIANKNDDSESVIESLINISNIYIYNKDYELALVNLKEALRLSNIKTDKFLHASILSEFGKLKNLQGENDEAITYFKEALSLVEESGTNPLILGIYAGLADAWAEKGNFNRAYEFSNKYQILIDSIYNRENLNKLNMIRVSFELEQTERDNQLLRQQNIYSQLALNRQQTIRNLFIVITAIVLVSLAFLFLLYHSKKKKNKLLALSNQQISKQKEELDKLYLEQYKLNETKTKFFSIVAHDLKSPFQSLLGFSELLSLEYDQFTDEQRIEALNNMYKVTLDTYKLIENLLEWGRIQTGNANVILRHINVKNLVESIIPIFELPLRNKVLEISVDVPSHLMAYADPNMMSAILRNLLSNAIKFSNPNGTIHIKGIATSDSSKLSVTDNGIGISPEIVDKLFSFDPKIRRNGTKGETGTGMGLGLCMEFMLLNHGMIKVTSKQGEGSTFTMIMQPGMKVMDPVTVS